MNLNFNTVNTIWTSSYNFVKQKVANGLNEQEKKVALIAAAYFAIAAVTVLFCRCYLFDSSNRRERDASQVVDHSNNKSMSSEILGDLDEMEEIELPPSQVKTDHTESKDVIAIQNVDTLRSILNYNAVLETLHGARHPNWKRVYFDDAGAIQGIQGSGMDPKWVTDQNDAKVRYAITLQMQPMNWDPGSKDAFSWEPFRGNDKIRFPTVTIQNYVKIMVDELNNIAKGAHAIAAKNPQGISNLNSWRTVLGDESYSTPTLLQEASNVNAPTSPTLVTPVLVHDGQKRSIQERLDKNRQFAIDQQAKQTSKNFIVSSQDQIPVVLTHKDVPLDGSMYKLQDESVGVASCEGTRDSMEDAEIAVAGRVQLQSAQHPFTLCGVFDGHAGKDASQFVKDHIQFSLTASIEQNCADGLTDEGIYKALKETFKELDSSYQGTAGTTATIALILDGKLWVANVGDSRALLIKKDKTIVQASEDAKPSIDRYRKKITDLGGTVLFGRVNGNLAVATAIGDKNVTDGKGTCVVLPNPKITCYPMQDIRTIVLACDGLFDVASTNEVGQAVLNLRDQSPLSIAKRLVHAAIENKSSDNVTVVVLNVEEDI